MEGTKQTISSSAGSPALMRACSTVLLMRLLTRASVLVLIALNTSRLTVSLSAETEASAKVSHQTTTQGRHRTNHLEYVFETPRSEETKGPSVPKMDP
jgi:hypothetical protein